MIELAPQHKIGLPLSGPVMIGAGFCGYGDAYRQLVDLTLFGAVVTRPITLCPRPTPVQPAVVEFSGGLVLGAEQANPGVKKVLRSNASRWERLGLPVIAHLPADAPDDLHRTARALFNAAPGLAGIELALPDDARSGELFGWVESVRAAAELPLLVKIPLAGSPDLAAAAEEAGADALVIGTPPAAEVEGVRGRLYGPALFHLTLPRLRDLAGTVDVPLVAAGGIHTAEQAQAFLDVGAAAVQLDSLLFVDPQLAQQIAQTLRSA